MSEAVEPQVAAGPAAAAVWRGEGAPLAVLSLVTVVWAVNFPVAKFAVQQVPPIPLTMIRVAIATIAYAAFLAGGRWRTLLTREALLAVLPLAALGIVANQLLFIAGLARTTPARSAIVVALIPACVALLAHRFLGERLNGTKWIGIVLAFAGVAIVEVPALREATSAEYLRGDGITLLAVFAFSSYTVLAKRALPRLGPLVAMAGCYIVASVLLLPLLPTALANDWGRVTAKGWAALGYMALAATVFAYLGHCWALSRIESGRVAVFTCLQPVLAGLLSWAWLHEPLPAPLLAGGAVVLTGVALVQKG